MRISAFLCISLVIVGAFALTEDQQSLNRLKEIEQTRFGKTILDTIQIQLSSGDPIEDLIEMLQQVEVSVQNEQKEDDAYIMVIRADCESDLSRLATEISAANDRADELDAEIAEKTPIRNEQVTLHAEKEELEEQVSDRIIELDEEQSEQDAEWAAEQQEHDRATYVIERAKEVIENGFGGSFLQKTFKTSTLVQVAEHFKTNSKAFKRNSWNKIFKLLAQITSSAPIQADSGAVSKILALIDNLLERIAESREIERREYEAYVAEYDSARENQVQLLNETQAHLANLENEISALNKRLENASAERDEQRERSRQKNIEKVGRTKWCDDEAESYASRRNDRLDSIRVVSDCVGLIESKIRVLKEFVAQRLG